jgi:hypothetical protein
MSILSFASTRPPTRYVPNRTLLRARAVGACIVLTLAACIPATPQASTQPPGTPSASGTPAGTVIGPAGGTVTGPSGAQVVLPAGAVAANTTIAIEQTSAGAPPRPEGFSPFGEMFAFTPHGIEFDQPVAVTVPFDPASVPAGTTPALYKTDATRTAWGPVAGATITGGTVTAQVIGFSDFAVGEVTREPIEGTDSPTRFWLFDVHDIRGIPLSLSQFGTQVGGELKQPHLFGKVDPTFEQDNGETPGLAMGEVFSSPSGETFWTYVEGPTGTPTVPRSPASNEVRLNQRQSFVKRSPDATLEFTVSAGFLSIVDHNGRLLDIECPAAKDGLAGLTDEQIRNKCYPMSAEVRFSAEVYGGPFQDTGPEPPVGVFFSTGGTAIVIGFDGQFKFSAHTEGPATTPFWSKGDFTVQEIGGSQPLAVLARQLHFEVDLSSIKVCPAELEARSCKDREFTFATFMQAWAWNARGRESGVAAFLRDPRKTGGSTVTISGLEATNDPLPEPIDSVGEPEPCSTGPNPAAGTLQFSGGGYRTSEGRSPDPGILVVRVGGTEGPVSATFTASDDTAVAGADYPATAMTVRFADGDAAPRLIDLRPMSDGLAELDESVRLMLSDAGGCATIGSISSAVLTIEDVDGTATPQALFTVGGTVDGLVGTRERNASLVLQDHHGVFFPVPGNGPFTFPDLASPPGTEYSVSIFNQPRDPVQHCEVTNGSGTITDHNVTDVVVECVPP